MRKEGISTNIGIGTDVLWSDNLMLSLTGIKLTELFSWSSFGVN